MKPSKLILVNGDKTQGKIGHPLEPKGEDCWTDIWKTELAPAMTMVEQAGNTSLISLWKSLKKISLSRKVWDNL